MDEEIAAALDRIKVLSLTVIAGTMGPQAATLTLDVEGKHVTTQSTGNGPVDAISMRSTRWCRTKPSWSSIRCMR